MTLRIYLAGRVAVEIDGQVVIDERQFRGRQGRHIFSYLVLERSHPVPRENLADLLWPQGAISSWEVALSAVISRFRGPLSQEAIIAEGVSLNPGRGQYQLHLPADVWIDMEAATSAIDRAEAALRNNDPDAIRGPATVVYSIARRPFLPGVRSLWADVRRSRLQRQLIRALNCMSRMWLMIDEPGFAIETADEAISLDPYRDSSYQLLMEAHAASGNHAEAVRTYHSLRERLANELGTAPSADSEALYLRLLN